VTWRSGVKEQQLEPFADRSSTQTTRADQRRLTIATLAYTLLVALRHRGL